MKNNDDNIHRQRRQTNHTVTNIQCEKFYHVQYSYKHKKRMRKLKKTDRKMMDTLRITVS